MGSVRTCYNTTLELMLIGLILEAMNRDRLAHTGAGNYACSSMNQRLIRIVRRLYFVETSRKKGESRS